jgi:hypothetical protein
VFERSIRISGAGVTFDLSMESFADVMNCAAEKVVRVSVVVASLTVLVVELEFAVGTSSLGALLIAMTVEVVDSV